VAVQNQNQRFASGGDTVTVFYLTQSPQSVKLVQKVDFPSALDLKINALGASIKLTEFAPLQRDFFILLITLG
jgi:hypothetical protein